MGLPLPDFIAPRIIDFRHCERSAAIHGCALPTLACHDLQPAMPVIFG